MSSLAHTFENWLHLPGTELAFTSFLALATRDDCRPFLLCYGGVGNGKTYLCEALAIELYKRHKFVGVRTMSEIMGTLKASIRQENGLPDPDTLLHRHCKAERLIIDDVGMGGTGTAWEYGQLEEIVCYRYRERLLTVLTTNRDLKDLPERIVSRFCDPDVGFVVWNEGKDYRRQK